MVEVPTQWRMNPDAVRQELLEKTLKFRVGERWDLDENMLNTSGEGLRQWLNEVVIIW